MEKDFKNTPEYAILESYAHDYENYDVLSEPSKDNIEEIRKKSPEVWAVAKKDFELYRFW